MKFCIFLSSGKFADFNQALLEILVIYIVENSETMGNDNHFYENVRLSVFAYQHW